MNDAGRMLLLAVGYTWGLRKGAELAGEWTMTWWTCIAIGVVFFVMLMVASVIYDSIAKLGPLRRWMCRRFGHRYVCKVTRGEGSIPLHRVPCSRCGEPGSVEFSAVVSEVHK